MLSIKDLEVLDLNAMYDDYRGGELMDECEEFDIWEQFNNHPLTLKAYQKAWGMDMDIDIEFFFDELYTSLTPIYPDVELEFDEQFDDEIQDFITLAWEEVSGIHYMMDLVLRIEGFEKLAYKYYRR